MHKRHSANFRPGVERFLLCFSSDGPEFNAEMKFDMDPDEPDYIEKDGETVENRANRMKSMNREEFKQHIGGVFEKHLNWRARHAKVSTTIGNLLPQYEQLLQEITDDVFNNPEYQRGIANYHTVYTDAWDMYLDAVGEGGNTSDPMYNHISRLPKAPGAYSNGQLLSIPEMYKGRRRAARTEYAKRWLRAKVGVEADPARAYARKKAEEMRIGYGRVWRHNIWKRLLKENQAVPTDEEVEAELEKLIQNRLGKNLTEAYLRPDLPPPPLIPERVIRKRGRSMHENIDYNHRTNAGRLLNTEYGTTSQSEVGVDKAYTFIERKRGNADAGYPHVVEYFKQGKKRRNKYVEGFEPKRGVLVIEPDADSPSESVVQLIDYGKAREMLTTLKSPTNRYYAPLMGPSGFFSRAMHEAVFEKTPVQGRECEYYCTDKMVLLYTRIYPELRQVTAFIKGLGLVPNSFVNLENWDRTNGTRIAAHMNTNPAMQDTWLNVLLVYCSDFEMDAKSADSEMVQLYKNLGIIGGPAEADALGDDAKAPTPKPIPPALKPKEKSEEEPKPTPERKESNADRKSRLEALTKGVAEKISGYDEPVIIVVANDTETTITFDYASTQYVVYLDPKTDNITKLASGTTRIPKNYIGKTLSTALLISLGNDWLGLTEKSAQEEKPVPDLLEEKEAPQSKPLLNAAEVLLLEGDIGKLGLDGVKVTVGEDGITVTRKGLSIIFSVVTIERSKYFSLVTDTKRDLLSVFPIVQSYSEATATNILRIVTENKASLMTTKEIEDENLPEKAPEVSFEELKTEWGEILDAMDVQFQIDTKTLLADPDKYRPKIVALILRHDKYRAKRNSASLVKAQNLELNQMGNDREAQNGLKDYSDLVTMLGICTIFIQKVRISAANIDNITIKGYRTSLLFAAMSDKEIAKISSVLGEKYSLEAQGSGGMSYGINGVNLSSRGVIRLKSEQRLIGTRFDFDYKLGESVDSYAYSLKAYIEKYDPKQTSDTMIETEGTKAWYKEIENPFVAGNGWIWSPDVLNALLSSKEYSPSETKTTIDDLTLTAKFFRKKDEPFPTKYIEITDPGTSEKWRVYPARDRSGSVVFVRTKTANQKTAEDWSASIRVEHGDLLENGVLANQKITSLLARAREFSKSEEADEAKVAGFDLPSDKPIGYIGIVDHATYENSYDVARGESRFIHHFPEFLGQHYDVRSKPGMRNINPSAPENAEKSTVDLLHSAVAELYNDGVRHFYLNLFAHGMDDRGIVFNDVVVDPMDILEATKRYKDASFTINTIACFGGEFGKAMEGFTDLSDAKDGRITVFLQSKPDIPNRSRGDGQDHSPLYHEILVQQIHLGKSYGQAHVIADRETKRLVQLDAEVWRSSSSGSTRTAGLDNNTNKFEGLA